VVAIPTRGFIAAPSNVPWFMARIGKMAKDATGPARKEANLAAAEFAAEVSRAEARSFGGLQAKAADRIKARSRPDAAALYVSKTKRNAFAYVAFWGAKRRSGWYNRPWFREGGRQQHPDWVGNSWQVGVKGQGPYAINDAIAANMDKILDVYAERYSKLK